MKRLLLSIFNVGAFLFCSTAFALTYEDSIVYDDPPPYDGVRETRTVGYEWCAGGQGIRTGYEALSGNTPPTSCWVEGWEVPENTRNCRIRVHIGAPQLSRNNICKWRVFYTVPFQGVSMRLLTPVSAGEPYRLAALPQGGGPDYIFRWSPAGEVTPVIEAVAGGVGTSQHWSVEVTDSRENKTLSGSITVTVPDPRKQCMDTCAAEFFDCVRSRPYSWCMVNVRNPCEEGCL